LVADDIMPVLIGRRGAYNIASDPSASPLQISIGFEKQGSLSIFPAQALPANRACANLCAIYEVEILLNEQFQKRSSWERFALL